MFHLSVPYLFFFFFSNQFNVIHAQQSAHPVDSTNLKDNSGLLQEVFGQRRPYNNSAVEWNNRQTHKILLNQGEQIKTSLTLYLSRSVQVTHWRMWMWRYLPKRLELWLRMVLAFPKLSKMGNTSIG